MPLLKSGYDYVKVYRPAGTPYTTASSRIPVSGEFKGEISEAIRSAVRQCEEAFDEEFDRLPVQERMVIEVVLDSFKAHVTLFELPG
jgi:hypothetical protein